MNVQSADIFKHLGGAKPFTGDRFSTTAASGTSGTSGTTFSHFLDAKASNVALSAKARQEKAEKAAGDLVSNALILPMLKQLRRSPWGENSVFSGGIGEKTFGPEFDMQIADRIAHSPRLGIKAALASRLMQRSEPGAMKPLEPKKLDIHG